MEHIRVKLHHPYFCVTMDKGDNSDEYIFSMGSCNENGRPEDTLNFNKYNYFISEKECKIVRDACNKAFKEALKELGVTVNYENEENRKEQKKRLSNDSVNHPSHYTSHPSGIECIEIARHYCFSIGNAIKYLWRAGLKKEQGLKDKQKEIEDLKKAIWYINDRINQLQNEH